MNVIASSVITCTSLSCFIFHFSYSDEIVPSYLADINTTNPLGFKGELAKCFSGIIRKLWSGEYEYFLSAKKTQAGYIASEQYIRKISTTRLA